MMLGDDARAACRTLRAGTPSPVRSLIERGVPDDRRVRAPPDRPLGSGKPAAEFTRGGPRACGRGARAAPGQPALRRRRRPVSRRSRSRRRARPPHQGADARASGWTGPASSPAPTTRRVTCTSSPATAPRSSTPSAAPLPPFSLLLLRRGRRTPSPMPASRSYAAPPRRCTDGDRDGRSRPSASSSTTSSMTPTDLPPRGGARLPGSAPFSKGQQVREQVLGHLAAMGIQLKYAHGEVGNILEDERQLVQHGSSSGRCPWSRPRTPSSWPSGSCARSPPRRAWR